MNLRQLVTLFSVIGASVSGQCSNNQTNIARKLFKDCMDQKQAALLKINVESEEEDNIKVYCDALEEFPRDARPPLRASLNVNRGKKSTTWWPFTLTLLQVNLGDENQKFNYSFFPELLTRPGLDLKSCPAFHTSKAPPTVGVAEQGATQLPLTSSSHPVTPIWSFSFVVFIVSNVR